MVNKKIIIVFVIILLFLATIVAAASLYDHLNMHEKDIYNVTNVNVTGSVNFPTNVPATFGDNQEVSIYYNGTTLIGEVS